MPDTWAPDALAAIDSADDLTVSPLRPDGVTYGTPTWIWAVVVDGDLYVRPYHGARSSWYQASLARPDGRIRAAGEVHEVTFEPAPDSLADRIDAAYRRKYAASPYLAPMVSERTRAAGVRIRPRFV